MRYLLSILLVLRAAVAEADSLMVVRALPLQARLLTVDEIGNAYIVRTDNNLVRYSENGDSTGFFRSVTNGDIGAVDATNPLRIILYYPDYGRLVLLDRMLAPKTELDLRRINVFNAPAVANSADGNIWIYDPFNARLRKINERGEEVSSGNDLRQQLEAVPAPSFMVERERRLYVSDTTQGIFVFDQYATYINRLPFTGIAYLQAYGTQLLYRSGSELISYELRDAREKVMALPEGSGRILNAALVRNRLYVLYENELVIYRLP